MTRNPKKASKRFFFEKKKQKTFASLAPNVAGILILRIKVFLLLFLQKKKILASFFLTHPSMPSLPGAAT